MLKHNSLRRKPATRYAVLTSFLYSIETLSIPVASAAGPLRIEIQYKIPAVQLQSLIQNSDRTDPHPRTLAAGILTRRSSISSRLACPMVKASM
jgi:hypothetical protein